MGQLRPAGQWQADLAEVRLALAWRPHVAYAVGMAETVIRTTVDKLSDELAPFAGNRRVEVRVIDATEEEAEAHVRALLIDRMNDDQPGVPAETVFSDARARVLAKMKAQNR
ncbi:hypothetical protein FBZ90_102303 [Nitrospirillum pindoramense]|uniref:Uncharacterized protein n=1 Tax=Nitrospirillum amazonense TaxID=28077 RepID=A0A560HFY7_9PROT|nr:hypothetical protein FBZ90_102303 [Nitrospirillum amazonense]